MNQPAMASLKERKAVALTTVKAATMSQPLATMGRRRAWAPAPQASPTRTVRAMESPRGTMKTVAAQLMATWCEARASLPMVPMRMVAMTKALISASNCRLAGQPTATSERTERQQGRRNQCCGTHSRIGGERRHQTTSAARVAARAIRVAMPAPSRPRAGAPAFPQIRIQLSRILSATPPSMIQNAGQGWAMASAWFFTAMVPMAGIMDTATMRK